MMTASRVYDSYIQAESAVRELEVLGVPPAEISIVANKYVRSDDTVANDTSGAGKGAGIGAALGGTAGLLAGLGLLAIPGLGPVVAVGWLAAAATGVAAGAATGGMVGALADAGEPRDTAQVYSEAVRRGGTLVTVRIADEHAAGVQAVLDRHQPIDPVVRGSEYRRTGWTTFDPAAPPYQPSDAELGIIRRARP